jgi:hypothetical protein
MHPTPKNQLVRGFKRALLWGLAFVLVPLLFLASCQSGLIYFPRPYGNDTTARWATRTAGKSIHFLTSQGQQRAFLQGNQTSPRNLWIVCGGNGSLALDWSDWISEHAPPEDAYLLVDFPGYGDCAGSPSPRTIRESSRAVVPAAAEALGWPRKVDPARLRIFGHSLGAAATLIAASEFKIQRGVLLTPFTSTMEMSQAMTGLPIGFIIWHRFDNSARLAEMATRGPGKMMIFHGTSDEAIPISMSRKLASEQRQIVLLTEIPQGRHNTLQETNASAIAAAMREIGKHP